MKNKSLSGLYFLKNPRLSKILRIMRITTFLLSVCIICTYAENSYSQNARVTITKTNVHLEEILNEIENQTDYLFIYNNNVDLEWETSVKVQSQPVSRVLNTLFRNTDIYYAVEGSHIVLSQRYNALPENPSVQQSRTISGVVIDASGEPIIGANILEKGTSNGATTNFDGQFNLTVSPQATLVVSYIGYMTQEVNVGNRTTFRIELIEDTQALEEVVVIGYGIVKKSDLAGAVSSMNAQSFKDEPITRIEDALQGRLAGVDVQTMSGAPGSDIKIRVRGSSSINKSNDPLYVVDGIIMQSGLSGLNTADIASIEVLKDASSTAIYGSRGANGVVLVTTRRGDSDRKVITFDTEIGFSTTPNRYDLLNPYEYAQALNDIKGAEIISAADMTAYQNGTKGIDWQDMVFQTGVNQNYKLSVSGGNKDTQYFISGNVLDQKGISKLSKFQRYAFRSNVSTKVTNWLNLTADVRLSHNKMHNNAIHNRGKANIIWQAINYSPTMEMMDETTGKYARDPYNSISENPYGQLMENVTDRLSNTVNGMLDLRFTIAKGLTLSVIAGADYNDRKNYSFESLKVMNNNRMSNSDAYRLSLQNTNNLTYTNKWGDHSLIATGVFEIATYEARNMSISGSNLLTESVGYWNVGLAQSRSESNSYTENSLASWVGRAMYNYKNRYNATITFRADGSSKFMDKKWGYFPSGALAWNMAEEDFMKDQTLFQQFKLRASYGIIGNQAINSYDVLGLLSSTIYSYGTDSQITGYWGNSFSTPDLTWEKTYQTDIGLDVSAFDQRLNFTFDWYLKQTKDCLIQRSIPSYNGGGSYWVNQGEIKNTGLEFSVNGYIFRNKDFTWNSSLNVSYMKNEVVDLAGDPYLLGESPANGMVTACTIVKPGHPIGSIYGLHWDGLDSDGNNIFRDLDGNGIIDSQDYDIIGKANPDAIFGWNNMFTYKNWEFNIFFNAAVGADKLNLTRFATACGVGDSRFITLREAYYKGFDKVGAGAEYASQKSQNNVNYGNSSQWLESADFIRLKNISIAYTIPKSVSRFADIRLSVSCQNLFTITSYKGMDPETSSVNDGANTDINAGIDIGAYPIPRTITVGARFNF